MKIIWSGKAKISYENIIDDILRNWSVTIAQDFEAGTNKLLDKLKVHKELCPASKYASLRKLHTS